MRDTDSAKRLINNHSDLFMCPLCGQPMNFNGANSLICFHRHCFDLSRRGYINFLLHPVTTAYGKRLWESRNAMCRDGFFRQMVEQISRSIRNEMGGSHTGQINILDAGCGEGSHLADIVKDLNRHARCDVLGVGLDISKEAVHFASREHSGLIWCVADLAKSPFMNKQFHVILNILAPANYAEFHRLIRDDGIVIKVVPASDYLQELRKVLYDKTEKQAYSNEKVVRRFSRHFDIADMRRIRYSFTWNKEKTPHLLTMTPLSWRTTAQSVQKALEADISSITVDLTVMVGKKKT